MAGPPPVCRPARCAPPRDGRDVRPHERLTPAHAGPSSSRGSCSQRSACASATSCRCRRCVGRNPRSVRASRGVYEPTPDPMRFRRGAARGAHAPAGSARPRRRDPGDPRRRNRRRDQRRARTPRHATQRWPRSRRVCLARGAAHRSTTSESRPRRSSCSSASIWRSPSSRSSAAAVFLLALMIMLVDERRGDGRHPAADRAAAAAHPAAGARSKGVLIAAAGAVFGILLSRWPRRTAVNRFFQWRYDTALVFVRITPRVALQSRRRSRCRSASLATLASSWTLLRRERARR